MSESNMTIAHPHNNKAQMALSALIHALWELDSYAIVRLVKKDNAHPILLLMAPSIENEYECLIDVELPFAEDVRQYKFPPLDRVVTVSGKSLTQHRNIPSTELQKAMDSYVEAMDISAYGQDDEGNATEYAAIEDTYSPFLHHLNSAIRFHAVHPTDPIPPPHDILTKYCHPPAELVEKAKNLLESVKECADVKPVPKKAKFAGRRKREADKPQSGLDIDALLRDPSNTRTTISAENAIPEFKQALALLDSPDSDHADAALQVKIQDFTSQMAAHVENYIRYSVGDSGYGRAVETLGVMREELSDLDEPIMYNNVLRKLKDKISKKELGGDRAEMWYRIKVNKLGPVHSGVQDLADMTEDEAKEFMRMPQN
jgi:ATP-dependent DNA helicase 2 subunit 2